MYKVYAKTNGTSGVISVNSDAFLRDVEGWVQIDEGDRNKHHHAQGNYLPQPIVTDDGVYRYKLVKGEVVERSSAEVQADIDAIPKPKPTANEIMFRALAQTDAISQEDVLENQTMFPVWSESIGQTAKAGSYWRHEDKLWRVNAGQGHVIQAGWAPGIAAALFSLAADPGEEWPEWIQPTGAHNAYAKGDKVTYQGKRWTSTADGNVWVPGAYGWEVYNGKNHQPAAGGAGIQRSDDGHSIQE